MYRTFTRVLNWSDSKTSKAEILGKVNVHNFGGHWSHSYENKTVCLSNYSRRVIIEFKAK